jgi:hypothetical protein
MSNRSFVFLEEVESQNETKMLYHSASLYILACIHDEFLLLDCWLCIYSPPCYLERGV